MGALQLCVRAEVQLEGMHISNGILAPCLHMKHEVGMSISGRLHG